MKIKDIAWLAGLLEGEGSFGVTKNSPVIQLQTTDKDVIERAAVLLEVRCFKNAYKPKGKPTYKEVYGCRIYGKRAIAWMLTLYPLLGQRRQLKVSEVVSQWKASPRKPRKATVYGSSIFTLA